MTELGWLCTYHSAVADPRSGWPFLRILVRCRRMRGIESSSRGACYHLRNDRGATSSRFLRTAVFVDCVC